MAVPAPVEVDVEAEARRVAARALEAFDCEGVTRADPFLTDGGEIFVNGHNTIPGFTEFSMYPILQEHTGTPCSELTDKLVVLAFERPMSLR